jgi:aspartate/methionine/tyrosine aminotransferase
LKPIRAQGTFYLAVEVDFSLLDITNDYEFARLLKAEQAVSVLPLSVFGNLQGFRLLTCAQDEYFVDFFGRIN